MREVQHDPGPPLRPQDPLVAGRNEHSQQHSALVRELQPAQGCGRDSILIADRIQQGKSAQSARADVEPPARRVTHAAPTLWSRWAETVAERRHIQTGTFLASAGLLSLSSAFSGIPLPPGDRLIEPMPVLRRHHHDGLVTGPRDSCRAAISLCVVSGQPVGIARLWTTPKERTPVNHSPLGFVLRNKDLSSWSAGALTACQPVSGCPEGGSR